MQHFANAEDDRNKVVSALAQVEARSTVSRMGKAKLLSPADLAAALDSLANEIRRIVEQPVNPPVLEAANALITRRCLRALDAIQLASAIVSRDLLQAADMRFISSDAELKAAALHEDFQVWDPVQP